MKRTYGFIGAGNMAGAIIGGISGAGTPMECIYVYDINPAQTQRFAERGAVICTEACQVCTADIVFLCVKPQNFPDMLRSIENSSTGCLIVTIAAGISTSYISEVLGEQTHIIRVMPNTPLMYGCGASAICKSPSATDEELELIRGIFSGMGAARSVDEKIMNQIIGVNGSSPAYIYYFAQAVVKSAEKQGIPADTAFELIAATLIGSGRMLLESGKSAEELIQMVCSKGGTTEKAMQVLYQSDFEQLVDTAMLACTKRAKELSGEE